MPTYQYRCKGCGTDLEVVQSFTDDALTTCESCGGELRKVFSAVGISFKGSGFYKTDNRSNGSSRSSGNGGSSSDSSSASSDSSSSSSSSSSSTSSSDGPGSKTAAGTSS